MKWFFLIALFISSSVVAQNYGDKKYYLVDSVDLSALNDDDLAILKGSLKKYHSAKNEVDRIIALNDICENMMDVSWEKYQFFQYQTISKALANHSSESEKKQLKNELSTALTNMGYIHKQHGNVTLAREFYEKALRAQKEVGDKIRIAQTLNNMGVLEKEQGNVPQALKYYHMALETQEELNDSLGISTSYFNIGAIHIGAGDLDLALEYFNKALALSKKRNSKKGISNAFNNIGVVYKNKGDLKKALDFFEKSLKTKKEITDNNGMIDAYINIGLLHRDLGNNKLALENFESALMVAEKAGIPKGIASAKINLARLKQKANEIDGVNGAFLLATNALQIAQDIGFPDLIRDASNVLFEIYDKQGNSQEALQMYKLYIQMRDSLSNDENQRTLSRRQAQYEYDKQKALDDKEHEKKLAIEREAQEKQQIIIYTSVFGLLLVVGFMFYAFNRLKVTRKQKRTIELQKDEIVDSINYAKRLQEAILPKQNELFANLKQGFLLYLPKDIVAGDFYWMHQTSNYRYIAVADCTGHGVPGALVSVVCATALDRAVKEFGLKETNEILDKTRTLVVETFDRSGEDVKDGMDISLARINFTTNELQFSGAFNPLWVVPKEGGIQVLRGDRQPIGKVEDTKAFTAHTHVLHAGDWVIQFSDGFADQFGGEKGKKFGAAQMKQFLTTMNRDNAESMKSQLESTFMDWKGSEEQLDDVCLIGWQVS